MSWNPKISKQGVTFSAMKRAESCNVNCHAASPEDPKPEIRGEYVNAFKNPSPSATPTGRAPHAPGKVASQRPRESNWGRRLGNLCLDFLLTLKSVPERRPWERKPIRD